MVKLTESSVTHDDGKREDIAADGYVQLDKQDAAIVFRANGLIEVFLPDEANENKPASDNVMTAAACAAGLRDPLILDSMKRKLEKVEKEYTKTKLPYDA